LSKMVDELGGSKKLVKSSHKANTGLEVLEMCEINQINIGNRVAKRAREVILASLAGEITVDVLIFNHKGKLVGRTNEH